MMRPSRNCRCRSAGIRSRNSGKTLVSHCKYVVDVILRPVFALCSNPNASVMFHPLPCEFLASSKIARIGSLLGAPRSSDRRGHLVHEHSRENVLCRFASVGFGRIDDFHETNPDVFRSEEGLACMIEKYRSPRLKLTSVLTVGIKIFGNFLTMSWTCFKNTNDGCRHSVR